MPDFIYKQQIMLILLFVMKNDSMENHIINI